MMLAICSTLPCAIAEEKDDPFGGLTADIAESRRELQAAIRRVFRERDLDDQYKLYAEAQRSLEELAPLLSENDATDMRRHLFKAFQQLQLPDQVRNPHGMRFRRVIDGADVVYLSEALTEGMFISFLNDRQISEQKLAKLLPQPTHDIAQETGVYSSPTPRLSLRGLNYYAAAGYGAWMKESDAYALPSAALLKRLGDVTAWAADPWKFEDFRRGDDVVMFGGTFRTVVVEGLIACELPEATYPKLTTHYTTSTTNAKKLYLKEVTQ